MDEFSVFLGLLIDNVNSCFGTFVYSDPSQDNDTNIDKT